MFSEQRAKLEMWGGVECTVNRVGDHYRDQLQASGHGDRFEDIGRIASLGLTAVRFPVIWERMQPVPHAPIDWSWSDARLNALRDHGIRPMIGLVHHGSGPRHASLLEGRFADELANYARAVAVRYPWVMAYTPVNEPLTTARFSALYGHWYPHKSDPRSFCEALLTECRAVALAMRAIREINPTAALIQTDDIGKTYSTPDLAYQADFENERRWITWDLLSGRVDPRHAMWSFFQWCGVQEGMLSWFLENPCPPDVIGLNYYMTSERFLDSRLERYPPCFHGGNHLTPYADVEAVRVLAGNVGGASAIIDEAWRRYQRPLAITEAHLGCSREEQLRWLSEVWHAAQQARERGIDVKAVTAWSLFGSFDWDSLLTRWVGRYEPGVFDLRAPAPRATALASLIQQLAQGTEPDHPVLDSPGWWRRPERLLYPTIEVNLDGPRIRPAPAPCHRPSATRRPLLIAGGRGKLAYAFGQLCTRRGLEFELVSREFLDIADRDSVLAAMARYQPWAIINAAGMANIDRAEADGAACHCANQLGPAILAAACSEHGVSLVTFSSDMVFDGGQRCPYVEDDLPSPLNAYGRAQAAAEEAVLQCLPAALVVRTSALFSPWDSKNFGAAALGNLRARRAFAAAGDATISPTYLPDLVHACLDLLIDGECGLWHLTSGEPLTWAAFARRILSTAGMAAELVQDCSLADLDYAAPRPRYSPLSSTRGPALLPALDDAVRRFVCEYDQAARC